MKKKVLKRVCSTAMGALMFVCLPLSAFAREIDVTSLTEGLSIDLANETEDLILTGINTQNGSVDLITVSDTDKTVILRNLSLDTSELSGGYALSVRGAGNIIIELDGTNILKSGWDRAGLQKENDGTLTIKDDNGTSGNLEAIGGERGAGIGGGYGMGMGTNIIIEGGTITAIGGDYGAGIGGGMGGSGTVTISGGNVTAIGGACGAGIGGGSGSNGSTITISGSSNVYVAGGSIRYFNAYGDGIGPGAAIGEGGKWDANLDPVQGDAVTPDVSGLYTTGSITTYAVGTSLDAIKQGTASGNTIVGTVPEPDTNTDTTTPEEPNVNEPKAEEPKKEEPKGEEPETAEPPVYTERSCIADVDVASLVGALLSSNASASTLNIEFEDNICLNPEIMTALFADNRVAKNCFFWHKGKRYVLHIGAVNKQSALYTEDFAELAEEPDGLAGFMMMAKIFANLGVTMTEVQ